MRSGHLVQIKNQKLFKKEVKKMSKPKVLIVDDNVKMHLLWEEELGEKVVLIKATSIEEAEEKFLANKSDLVAVVVDACVPGNLPNTQSLVEKWRKTFEGPMIAISNSEEYRKELLNAGCNHESEKDEMPTKVTKILGL